MWARGSRCHDVRPHGRHAFPVVRARGAPTGRPTTAGSAASPPAWPSTSACRCSGCGWACWRWSRSAASARCCTPDCGCSCRRSGTPTRSPRASTRPPGRASAAGAAKRRLTDYGPLVAVGAIAIGVLLLVTLATGQTPRPRPAAARRCRRRAAVVAGRRGAAPALARPVAPDGPDARASSAAAAGGPTLRIGAGLLLLDRGDHAVLAALRQPDRGAQRRPRRGLRHRRAGLHGRSVAAPALRRPQRGARGAGAVRGARRRRRPPARLGAPDPGPDPALGRRPGHGLPPGPRAGARPALVALRRRRRRTGRRSAARCARWRPRSRTRTACHVEVVCVGDAPHHRRRPAAGARGARGDRPTPRSTPGPSTVDVYAEATAAGVEVFVRDRGAGFDPDRVADDRQGVRGSIVGRMERHGGDRLGAQHARARAPRSGCPCRSARPGHQDRPRESS